MRIKGKITKWNDEKGFGFLKPSTGDKEVFVHISEFNNRNRRPKLNELVTYSLATDKQGRPRAVHATLPGDKRRKTANHSNGVKLTANSSRYKKHQKNFMTGRQQVAQTMSCAWLIVRNGQIMKSQTKCSTGQPKLGHFYGR
jgi:cold shock CspA family protein